MEGQSFLGPLVVLTVVQAIVVSCVFAVPVLAPEIGRDLGINPAQVGIFSSIIFGVAIYSSMAGGMAAVRHGSFRVCQLALLLVAVGTLLVLTGEPWVLALGALLIGAGFGPETPAGSHLLSRIVPRERRSLIFSIRQTGNQFGGILVATALPALVPLVGWRGALIATAGLALVALVLLIPFDRRYEPREGRTKPATRPSMASLLALALRNRALRELALSSAAFSAIQMVLNGFLVNFAVADLDLSLRDAGLLLAGAQVAGLVGRIGWGYVAGRFLSARVLLALLGLVMALCGLAILLIGAATPFLTLQLLFALFGLTASGWNGVFLAEISVNAPEGMTAEAMGGVLVVTYCGLIAAPLGFAGLVALWGYAAAYGCFAVPCLAAVVMLARKLPPPVPKEAL